MRFKKNTLYMENSRKIFQEILNMFISSNFFYKAYENSETLFLRKLWTNFWKILLIEILKNFLKPFRTRKDFSRKINKNRAFFQSSAFFFWRFKKKRTFSTFLDVKYFLILCQLEISYNFPRQNRIPTLNSNNVSSPR